MKKNKFICLCLSAVVTSSFFVSTYASAKTTNTNSVSSRELANKTNGVSVVNNLEEFKNLLKDSLSVHQEQVALQINTRDYKQYNLNIINEILDENPNLCYGYRGASGSYSIYGNTVTMNIKINYARSSSQLNTQKQEADRKADEIIRKVIKPGMSDFDKELALHDYIVNNSIYDSANMNNNVPEDHNAYGVLVKGVGVCESYAKAMSLLLNKVGVECIVVTGNAGGPHAWNKVKLDGQWYNLDVTWDDPVMQGNAQVLKHTYFNVSDNMIKQDHMQDSKFSKYAANSTKYYYFNMGKGEVDSKGNMMKSVNSYNEAVSEAVKSAKNGQKFVSLQIKDNSIKNTSSYVSKLMNDICNQARKGVSVQYSDNKLDKSIIYVEFNFK